MFNKCSSVILVFGFLVLCKYVESFQYKRNFTYSVFKKKITGNQFHRFYLIYKIHNLFIY